jgi:Protein of unknown function (DUF3618)
MSRDPRAIEREIEQTRAELARTVDLIAERLSPRRAAGRGATRMRQGIEGVFQRENGSGNGQVRAPDGEIYEPREPRAIHSVPLPPGAAARTLRKDRVAIAIGAFAAFAALIIVLRRRRR